MVDSPSAADAVHGVVRDDNGPLAGAVVRIQGAESFVLTSPTGRFELNGVTTPSTITAWSNGYYAGWTKVAPGHRHVMITLKKYYTTDNPDYEWFSSEGIRGSETCGHCMPSIYDEWNRDSHSKSATNPRFLTMYSGTDTLHNRSAPRRYIFERDYGQSPLPPDPDKPDHGPGYKIDYPDTAGNCASCHVPAAAAKRLDPFEADAVSSKGIEREGIFCEFCHKIGDVLLDPNTNLPMENMTGVLSMRLCRPHESQELFFGTHDDVTRQVSKLPLLQESAFCAPCHFGAFWDTVIYNSYGEWLKSPYSNADNGKTCQDCHMPVTDASYFVSPDKGGVRRKPGSVSGHKMLGITDVDFMKDTAELEVAAQFMKSAVLVETRVTNRNGGHHIPTGHPARNILLVVHASDSNGKKLNYLGPHVIPDWGGVGNDSSDFAGRPGKGYAKILKELWTNVTPTVAYWNPTILLEDTRIPALETDVSQFKFEASARQLPVTIQARLIFRRAFKKLAKQKKWNIEDIIMEETEVVVD